MIDRRELLWLGLASLAAMACGVRRAPLDLAVLPARRYLADARSVGEAWLSAVAPRPSAEALANELSDGAPRGLEVFAAHLRRRHEGDLATGRTERVDGWLLSRTEAVLYGLLASLPAPPSGAAAST